MALAPKKINVLMQIYVLFCGNCCPTFNIGRNVSPVLVSASAHTQKAVFLSKKILCVNLIAWKHHILSRYVHSHHKQVPEHR